MPSPSPSMYDSSGVVISNSNKINFTEEVYAGSISDIIEVNLWNDKGGSNNSDAIVAPKLFAYSSPDDASVIFNGTVANGNQSMLEARSCGATNTIADADSEWTPISQTEFLQIGDIPSNAARTIEFRMNVPFDSPDISLKNFSLKLIY